MLTKIQDDIKFIKKITDGLRSQVSHSKIYQGDVGGAVADQVGEKSAGPYSMGKGIDKDKIDEVAWLPADLEVIEPLKALLK